MNLVGLAVALSSANSGINSTGRMLRALADRGEAPRLTAWPSTIAVCLIPGTAKATPGPEVAFFAVQEPAIACTTIAAASTWAPRLVSGLWPVISSMRRIR